MKNMIARKTQKMEAVFIYLIVIEAFYMKEKPSARNFCRGFKECIKKWALSLFFRSYFTLSSFSVKRKF